MLKSLATFSTEALRYQFNHFPSSGMTNRLTLLLSYQFPMFGRLLVLGGRSWHFGTRPDLAYQLSWLRSVPHRQELAKFSAAHYNYICIFVS